LVPESGRREEKKHERGCYQSRFVSNISRNREIEEISDLAEKNKMGRFSRRKRGTVLIKRGLEREVLEFPLSDSSLSAMYYHFINGRN